MTLVEFARRLNVPELADAVIARQVAARDDGLIGVERSRAYEWMKRYVDKQGVDTSGSRVFIKGPRRTVAARTIWDSQKLKRTQAALYEQCRGEEPYHRINAPHLFLERIPAVKPVILDLPEPVNLPVLVKDWQLTRSAAQSAYDALLTQARGLTETIATSNETIDQCLAPSIAEGRWAGHPMLTFSDGWELQVCQLKFGQEIADAVLPRVLPAETQALYRTHIPAKVLDPIYRMVDRATYMRDFEGDSQPFEGD